MRLVMIGLATAVAALAADVQSGNAQFSARYCSLTGGHDSSGSPDCSYNTMEQCRATASGLGGNCFANPQYSGRPSGVDQQDRRPRRSGRRRDN